MEWNRGVRPTQPGTTPAGHPSSAAGSAKKNKIAGLGSMRFASVLLLFSATLLVVALLWYMVIGGPASEDRFVDKSKMQAVFLNGGQVYFGRINDLNGTYMRVSDIYYLRVNQQVQPNQQGNQNSNDISLVKLGCELHGPQDSMLINRDMVIFWENLKDDGQVAKAVQDYKKANPEGQKCETTAAQQQNSAPAQTPAPTQTPATNNTNTRR